MQGNLSMYFTVYTLKYIDTNIISNVLPKVLQFLINSNSIHNCPLHYL